MTDTLFAMDPIVLTAFMGASVLLYLTPGIDMLFTIATGLSGGARAGLAAGLGVAVGSLFHTLVAALGVAAIIQTSAFAYLVLKTLGAAYLAYLAVKTWNAPPPGRVAASGRVPAARAFARGALGNMLNPKVSLFILAFLPHFTDPAAGPIWQQITILGVLFSLGSVPFLLAFGFFAASLARKLTAGGRIMNKVSSIVFGGLAARLVLD